MNGNKIKCHKNMKTPDATQCDITNTATKNMTPYFMDGNAEETKKNAAKDDKMYECKDCNFKCSKKSNYIYHLYTNKHLIQVDGMIMNKKIKAYKCKCGKEYMSNSGLWKHNKICAINDVANTPTENIIISSSEVSSIVPVKPERPENEIKDLTLLVMEVVKNNQDFQKQMFEMCKTIQSNITMNNNCNNTFNMQVFLNEECKDAINITDFVNSVNIQLEDVENVGRLGYANGISNIIVKELKMLDVYKRPIHCSDVKREIFYVKDNDVWERETPENSKLIKAIQGISKKNMVKLNDWRDKYPDCMDCESQYNDIYIKLMLEACGGRGDQSAGENKIIKNIAKEVVINKKP